MSARLLHEWRVFWSSTTSSMSSCDDEVLADLVVNRRDKWCLLLALQFVVSPLLHSRLRKLSNFWWHGCLLIHQSKHIYTGRSFIFHQVALLFHSSPLVGKLRITTVFDSLLRTSSFSDFFNAFHTILNGQFLFKNYLGIICIYGQNMHLKEWAQCVLISMPSWNY